MSSSNQLLRTVHAGMDRVVRTPLGFGRARGARLRFFLPVLLVIHLATGTACAASIALSGAMRGIQETPPVTSSGVGTCTAWIR
jgi:hypothetical protein